MASNMDSGIYTELKDAVKGQVVVRFPPEASGFLHIGHAKAALLNYHYKTMYEGVFIMRFDDTNPEKEKEDYEEAIMQDVRSLGIQWDRFSYTSDYFDLLQEKCLELIKKGKAYADDTPAEEMRLQREKREPSGCRDQSVEENLRKWNEMMLGSEEGQKCCIRAKMDYSSKNGCLRDPVMYRCKNEPHPRHGTKYKVYPTYDFACPVVDSIEGVTHSLRTSEYVDRDPQFAWFCEALGLRTPLIAAYSRLNMMNTILSKRKLTWLVDEKIVDGWDDPRMPTVQGILRRGLTVEGLKRFIIAQGSSKHIVYMEWDKIWAFNKKYLDPIVPRFTAIEQKDAVPVDIDGYNGQLTIEIAVHPKDPSMGARKVNVAKTLYIEQVDGAQLKVGDVATFLSLGNVKVTKVEKNENQIVTSVRVTLDLDNKDFKKTLKVSWLNKDSVYQAKLIYYDHIITKSVLDKEEDFKTYVNRNSKVEVMAFIEPDCRDLKSRTIVQFTRKGNFICDKHYDQASNMLVFNYIPDGTSKNPYTTVVSSSGKKPKEASDKPKKEAKQQAPVDPARAAEIAQKQLEKAEAKAQKRAAHAAGEGAKKNSGAKGPAAGDSAGGKQTKLAIGAKKEENFSEWYTEVITKGEMVEYYDVSGCYIFRPWSYAIWEKIQAFLDAKIKSIGVENAYFPMFVSRHALEREKDHIADFAPEVAWVTRSGQSELAEPIAIRPTSETVMYPSFAKWVQSRRDLPIRLNQWNNVVRWEFKDPTPFIRTREFLWQEGHTAFATLQEAVEEVEQVLEFYASVYEDLLAIPVVRGRKSEKEKFPGANFTLTIEGYVKATGRGIQAATSHHLGQNFSKMFDISFQSADDTSKAKEYAYQNSWGLSTRTIGVLVMTHSDNKGLVLPPRVSPIQVVVMPVGITVSTSADVKEKLYKSCSQVYENLTKANIRTKLDDSDHYTPGRKFNYYEQKGVCIRVELGPKDLEKSQVMACRRDTGEKVSIGMDKLVESIAGQLEDIQKSLYAKAKREMDENQIQVTCWQDFLAKLNAKCTLVAPFCGRPSCEDNIKKDSVRDVSDGSAGPLMGAKSLCIPKQQPEAGLDVNSRCIYPSCSEKPLFWTLFGRSY